ncbi:hypothetical protein M23134_00580, partial [Microscilla marina ATCC 23134]
FFVGSFIIFKLYYQTFLVANKFPELFPLPSTNLPLVFLPAENPAHPVYSVCIGCTCQSLASGYKQAFVAIGV